MRSVRHLNRVLLPIAACVALLAVGWGIYRAQDQSHIAPVSVVPAPGVPSMDTASTDNSDTATVMVAASSLLDQIRRHEVDFMALLNDIRQHCLPDWTRTQCNEMTRDFLQERFRANNDLAELLEAYDQYIRCEDYVVENRSLQNLGVEETYRTLQHLRTQFIDADIRRWMFGLEDARMAYEFALQDFMSDKALKLTPAERLHYLEDLRRETLGEFHDLFVAREDPILYVEARRQLLQLSDLVTPEEQALKAELEAEFLHLQHRNQQD